jgi:hypothetical protein
MKAYDFDGVIVPDFDYVDIEQSDFEEVWLAINPIYEPKGPWIVITGRTSAELIIKWCKRHLDNPPTKVYANDIDITPVYWKLAMLQKLGITEFVESDPAQATFLYDNGIDCKIYKDIVNA